MALLGYIALYSPVKRFLGYIALYWTIYGAILDYIALYWTIYCAILSYIALLAQNSAILGYILRYTELYSAM